MLRSVFFLIDKYLQIFGAVVAFISVDMVDDLSRFERSAEHILRDHSMLMPSV